MTAPGHAPLERRFSLPHLELAAQEWGAPEEPVVIALHGWLDNAASFSRLAPLLGGARILAVDLAGHGLSGHRPAGVAYQLWDYVYDLLQLANQQGWRRFALLGHSMGASVAALMAAALPERISRLALIDGALPLTAAAEDAPARLGQAFRRLAQIERRLAPVYADREQAVVARMRAAFPVSREAAERLVERGLAAVEGGFRWRSDPRLLLPSPVRFSEDQVRAFIGQIQCPVRLVLGDRGLYPQAAERERLMALGLAPRVLCGGHHLHLDDPAGAQAVAAALADFLVD